MDIFRKTEKAIGFFWLFFNVGFIDRAFVSVTKKSTNENGTHDEDGVVSFILLAIG